MASFLDLLLPFASLCQSAQTKEKTKDALHPALAPPGVFFRAMNPQGLLNLDKFYG